MPERIRLVYQGSFGSVYSMTTRLFVGSFAEAEQLVRQKQQQEGARLSVFHCDEVGDISRSCWLPGPGSMMRAEKAFGELRPCPSCLVYGDDHDGLCRKEREKDANS